MAQTYDTNSTPSNRPHGTRQPPSPPPSDLLVLAQECAPWPSAPAKPTLSSDCPKARTSVYATRKTAAETAVPASGLGAVSMLLCSCAMARRSRSSFAVGRRDWVLDVVNTDARKLDAGLGSSKTNRNGMLFFLFLFFEVQCSTMAVLTFDVWW